MRMEVVSSFLEAVRLGLAIWQSPGEFLGGGGCRWPPFWFHWSRRMSRLLLLEKAPRSCECWQSSGGETGRAWGSALGRCGYTPTLLPTSGSKKGLGDTKDASHRTQSTVTV